MPITRLPSPLRIDIDRWGATTSVALTGDVDIASAEAATGALRDALTGDATVVVLDLAGVTFMDSTGVHMVLDGSALARDRGVRLVVLPAAPEVHAVFGLAGVAHRVRFTASSGRLARSA